MKAPADGWDREEREALEPIEAELETIRARHTGDPQLNLLRAASADALPSDLQARVSEHLAESAWSRALVAGIADADPSLDAADEDRMLARIRRPPIDERSWFAGRRSWAPLLATGALVAIVATVLMSRRVEAPAPLSPVATTRTATVARAEPQPFELPLRPPEVRLSVAALTWRGPSGAPSFVDSLAPALDAFRSANYARAAQALEPLERRYPNAIEPPFYRGISLLFLNDVAASIADLRKAQALADETFSSDVAWYLAVAELRAGDSAGARERLQVLCRAAKGHASDACDAIARMPAAK
jgi:hypothetical protein